MGDFNMIFKVRNTPFKTKEDLQWIKNTLEDVEKRVIEENVMQV